MSALPQEWRPAPTVIEWAKAHGWSKDGFFKELEAFQDYWHANGRMKHDWNATFRMWLRNAAERFGSPNAPKPDKPKEVVL